MSFHDCVESTGYKGPNGYRMVYSREFYELYGVNRATVFAHRVAYCEAKGLKLIDIAGKVVRHKCDNRVCINPDHLELGTHADNSRDMVERGRHKVVSTPGSANGNSKLTEEQVLDIRTRYKPRCKANGAKPLAKEYGVDRTLIWGIVSGKAWRHVS